MIDNMIRQMTKAVVPNLWGGFYSNKSNRRRFGQNYKFHKARPFIDILLVLFAKKMFPRA